MLKFVQFIECSGCEAWYHFGCLSVAEDDPRTAEGVDLYCPPCEASMYVLSIRLSGAPC